MSAGLLSREAVGAIRGRLSARYRESVAGSETVPGTARTYARDWSRPTSFGIWGGSPGDRARLAWALAHRIDAAPYWLQIEIASEPSDPAEHAVVDQLPTDRRFHLRPEEFAPLSDQGNVATWFLRTDIQPGDRLNRLADFARLPLLAQRLLGGRSAYSPTKSLVIANANGLNAFYPQEEGGIRPFVEAINEYATTLILTVTSTPNPNVRDIDYVFHLTTIDREGQQATRATVEHGAPRNAPGLFTVEERRDLDVLLDELRGP